MTYTTHQTILERPPSPPPPPSTSTPSNKTEPNLPSSLSTSPTSSNEDLNIVTSTSSTSLLPHLPSNPSLSFTMNTPTRKQHQDVNEDGFISLVNLSSITLASTIIASKIIQNHSQFLSTSSHQQTKPKSRLKDDGSIVTDADGESQRLITSYIKSVSPLIRIVGEESNDEIKISQQEYHKNTWWGISPMSKRKLMNKEKKYEGFICDYVKREVMWRFKKVKMENEQNEFGDNLKADHDELYVDPSRVSVYVDPLDGTSSYAKGDYEAVTILAGVMLDNVPIFGVIVKPFGHEGYDIDYHKVLSSSTTSSPSRNNSKLGFQYPCSAIYGGTLVGGAFVVSGDELSRSRLHRNPSEMSSTSKNSLSIPKKESESLSTTSCIHNATNQQYSQCKAIISKSKGGGVVQQCIDSLSSKGLLHPEPLYITGAGYKTMRLLLGTYNETMWFFPKPGTSLWDVAAADALLRVMGGRISDKFGRDLDYSKKWTEADNLDGIIACSDTKLHEKCMQLYHDECWDDVEEK
jgi:3'-phosphoadenosine 5'-phosphosulfate (PAPS) 3'-phosphatase